MKKNPLINKYNQKPTNILYTIKANNWKDFQHLAVHVLKSNPFYKKKYAKKGIVSINQLKDWTDYYSLPFISKKDLVQDQIDKPPYGNNATLHKNHYFLIRSTSGTSTGIPFFIPISRKDYKEYVSSSMKLQKFLGLKRNDVLLDLHPPGTQLIVFEAATNNGVTFIPWQMQTSHQLIKLIKDSKATVVWGSISMLLNIVNTAEKEKFNLKKSSVRLIFVGAEIITPNASKRIESAFGVPCRKLYAATEFGGIGYGCPDKSNKNIIYHIFNEDYILEIIDPKTNLHSSIGELVLTNLRNFDYPLIRYKTGNLVRLVKTKCLCKYKQISLEIIGRTDNAIRIFARYLYPDQLESILLTYDEIKDYHIELRKFQDKDYILIKIVPTKILPSNFIKEVQEKFILQFGIKPIIEILPKIYTRQDFYKIKHFTDLRSNDSLFKKEPEEPLKNYLNRIINFFNYRFLQPIVRIVYGN